MRASTLTSNILICVVGPTAIGKTSLAIKLAQHFGCDIISADSRQVYREMTIGTAVPTPIELSQVKHHFIQNKSIHDDFNVGIFEKEGLNLLNDLFKKKNIQILVGGSGLYVNALVKGVDEFPEINPEIRQFINEQYDKLGLNFLVNELQSKDPNYYQFLHETNPQTLKNPQRLKRFVEVCTGTQQPYSNFLNKKKYNRDFSVITIGLEADRDVIYSRINLRVDQMIYDGLVDEAQKLYHFKNINALQTVGYQELFDYFDGKVDLRQAIENIKQNTRKFAKRQLTWFKRDTKTIWFDYRTELKKIIEILNQQFD